MSSITVLNKEREVLVVNEPLEEFLIALSPRTVFQFLPFNVGLLSKEVRHDAFECLWFLISLRSLHLKL